MILMKDILREGESALRQKCATVELPLSEEDVKLIKEMAEFIRNSNDPEISEKYELRGSVGLSANQLGILKKICVIDCYDELGNRHKYAMINPKMISYSSEKTYLKNGEGCLSVDRDVPGIVNRPRRVSLESYIYDFVTGEVELKKLRLKNYVAVVFQHEYDHLKGVMFYDYINADNPMQVSENSTPVTFDSDETK